MSVTVRFEMIYWNMKHHWWNPLELSDSERVVGITYSEKDPACIIAAIQTPLLLDDPHARPPSLEVMEAGK